MLKNDYVTKLINLESVKFKDVDIQEDEIRFFVASEHDVTLSNMLLPNIQVS